MEVLAALETIGDEWGEDETVIVEDRTGQLGKLYSFLAPEHLTLAWQAKGHSGNLFIENKKIRPGVVNVSRRVVLEKVPSPYFLGEAWQARFEP